MSKYDLNFKRLALLMLPTFWRKPLLAGFAYAIMVPLNYINMRFALFRRSTDYRLTHNGQVFSLRAVLNDQFDPGDRAITVTDNTRAEVNLASLWIRAEDKPLLLPVRETGRALFAMCRGADRTDFWVNVPQTLLEKIITTQLETGTDKPPKQLQQEFEARLKAIVGIYKLSSKRFLITYIN